MSDDLSIRDIRLDKLAKLRELGFDPYATERFDRTDSASGLLKRFAELGGEKEDAADKTPVSFAGRLVSMRIMGKAAFAHLSDGDDKIQGYFKKDEIGESAWEAFNLLDIGDHVGVTGYLFTTKTGEKSIHVKTLTPLSKSLQTLPLGKVREIKDEQGNKIGEETWYELEDVEQRYRHRHLDLVCNTEARQMLLMRSRIVRAVRDFFDSNGYFEVETPILQLEAGGAAARTFNTFYNAYDMDVKLRISLELYLKRIICGDVPKVYEIGRVFRNEGVSNRHNPEFTLLEWYEAYANLEDVMTTVEELFRYVSRAIAPSSFAGDGSCSENEEGVGGGAKQVDWSKPWHRVDLLSAIEKYSGLTADDLSTLEKAKKALGDKAVVNPTNGKRIHVGEEANLGGLIEKLLEVFVEPTLQEPTFVVGYPLETSPLAKKDPNRPGFTRRFEGYVFGREICNAFSEINDPQDQRERFEHQVSERSRGDEEAHPMDEDFLYALEGGMPPTGGCGIGIDRLVMLMTGAEHLREILLFPMMKPN